MTTPTSTTPATATESKSFGQVGYDAYGNHPRSHGTWKTFDGRPMPTWAEYTAAGPGSAGSLTQERWEAAAQAIITEYERRMADIEAARPKGFLRRLLDLLWPNGAVSLSVSATKRTLVHGEPLDEPSNTDGQIDPFLLGISEIAAAARDLAEATRAADGDPSPVGELLEDVTKALHGRVRALATPSSEPKASA